MILALVLQKQPSRLGSYHSMGGICPKLTHSATKLTPFQCVVGYQPSLFLWNPTEMKMPTVDDWFRRSEAVWKSAHWRMEQVARSRKQFADQHHSEAPRYEPEDRVWQSTQDVRQVTGCKNLSPRYMGPE